MEKRYYWAIFFIFMQIVVVFRNYSVNYNHFFWYCDFVPLLFAFAFFIGNNNLVKGLINFGLVPQTVFLFNFIYVIIYGGYPIGINEVVMRFTPFFAISTIFTHLATILALILTFKIKPSKKILLYSVGFIFFIYFITLIFVSPDKEINFVYSAKSLLSPLNLTIPNLTLLWPILIFLLVVLPSHGVQYLVYNLYKKFRKKIKRE
jgi:hypothetical protein